MRMYATERQAAVDDAYYILLKASEGTGTKAFWQINRIWKALCNTEIVR